MISPATAFEAMAKPAMVAPAAVIRARNWRRDIPSYALEIQSFQHEYLLSRMVPICVD